MVVSICGCVGVWTCGNMGMCVCVCGFVDMWAYECVGMWLYGRMSV